MFERIARGTDRKRAIPKPRGKGVQALRLPLGPNNLV
jgi:hypothetical protein